MALLSKVVGLTPPGYLSITVEAGILLFIGRGPRSGPFYYSGLRKRAELFLMLSTLKLREPYPSGPLLSFFPGLKVGSLSLILLEREK